MAGYEYSERVLQSWDWPAAAAAYKEKAENEARNCLLWRGRYEALVRKYQDGLKAPETALAKD